MAMLRILWSGGSQCLKAWACRDLFLLDACVFVCLFFVTSICCVCAISLLRAQVTLHKVCCQVMGWQDV